MTVENTAGGTLITGPHIEIARLIAIKGAVKLECLGIRRRGKSAKRIAIDLLGLDKRAGYDTIVGALNKRIEELSKEAS